MVYNFEDKLNEAKRSFDEILSKSQVSTHQWKIEFIFDTLSQILETMQYCLIPLATASYSEEDKYNIVLTQDGNLVLPFVGHRFNVFDKHECRKLLHALEKGLDFESITHILESLSESVITQAKNKNRIDILDKRDIYKLDEVDYILKYSGEKLKPQPQNKHELMFGCGYL